jgi:hypothetical protein
MVALILQQQTRDAADFQSPLESIWMLQLAQQ